MSGSTKVKIKNKRTGELTLGDLPYPVTRSKDLKKGDSESVENVKPEPLEKSIRTRFSDKEENKRESTDRRVVVEGSKQGQPPRQGIFGLADFIVYAYSRKGKKPKSLSAREVKGITKHARLDEQTFDKLLVLAKGDHLLAVPRQIVFSIKGIKGAPLVNQEMRRFVSEVLKGHPVYQHNGLVPVIENLDHAVGPVEALRVLAKLSQETLAILSGLEQANQKDVEVLRLNAINCLAIWLWESRGTQVNRVTDWLYEGYWDVAASTDVEPAVILETLTDITEVKHVGKACVLFKTEADEQARRVVGLQSKIASLENKIAVLIENVNDLKKDVQKHESTVRQISLDLASECAAHADSRAHLGDDREHLRANVVRRVRQDVTLLNEGLQALRKNPPKVRVMDDHAERVLNSLQGIMRFLEEGE